MSEPFRSPMPRAVPVPQGLAEQTFFDDPAIDRLMGVVMNLATEVFVLRERCAAQEAQLAARGLVDTALLGAEPGPQQVHDRAAEQQAFVEHLLEPLRGVQVTRPARPDAAAGA